ncbi:MAG TPA: Fic family protein [Methanocorpusculum sp.]|nr:Fic family protein [Methanocorpusculum sp.]
MMTFTIRYRVEERTGKTCRNPYYYLIRECKANGKKCIVATYLSSGRKPAEEEITAFLADHIHDSETKIREKYLQARHEALKSQYPEAWNADDVECLRYLYNHLRNLIPAGEMACFEKEAEYRYIHGTTAIEGNTLSYGDTTNLLDYGILPGGKPAREVFEVQNYLNVKKYRDTYTGKITLTFMKKLHSLIMANILPDPGEFRTADNILISGYDYQVTPALLIEDELTGLVAWYYQMIRNGYHPFECAVLFHYRFETIHPFADGNGRVGRELLNYLLERSGYPRMIIGAENRSRYLSALHAGNRNDTGAMIREFAGLMTEGRLETMEKTFSGQIDLRIRGSQKTVSAHTLEEFL